jgi:hypothetical protein
MLDQNRPLDYSKWLWIRMGSIIFFKYQANFISSLCEILFFNSLVQNYDNIFCWRPVVFSYDQIKTSNGQVLGRAKKGLPNV